MANQNIKVPIVKHERPPQWIADKCFELFRASYDTGTVFAYGENIHTKKPIPTDVYVHEAKHLAQQEIYGDPDIWWRNYFNDAGFRYKQELEAYRIQWAFIEDHQPDRNRRAKALHNLAVLLSTYHGIPITYSEALEAIKGKKQ